MPKRSILFSSTMQKAKKKDAKIFQMKSRGSRASQGKNTPKVNEIYNLLQFIQNLLHFCFFLIYFIKFDTILWTFLPFNRLTLISRIILAFLISPRSLLKLRGFLSTS